MASTKRARTTKPVTLAQPSDASVPAAAATPDDVKAMFTWKYFLTPERFIVCRHLRFEGMLMEGLIPMPSAPGAEPTPPAPRSEEARETATSSARRYVCAVALQPRILEGQAEAAATGALWVGDLPTPVLVDLMNAGMDRVVTFDPRAVGLTDPTFPADVAAPGRDGAPVRHEAEQVRD